MERKKGYTLIILLFAIFVMSIGLLVAVPLWQTQIQREREEELIFRGEQYMEAVRLYQLKNPGRFPESFDELLEEKCLRKLFRDPVTPEGEWDIILLYSGVSSKQSTTAQKILVAPLSALPSIQNPQIIGVVSSSTQTSIKIYLEQETYDRWLFFYGRDPDNMPEIVYFGEEEKD